MRTRTFRNSSLVLAAVLSFSALGAVGATPASAETSTWLGQSGGGQTHECAVRSDGRVKCWGYPNPGGYMGSPNDPGAYPLTVGFVPGITTATKVSVGGYNTCILLADTTVKCMGDNSLGQIGDGTTTARNDTPTAVTGLTGVKDIVLGGNVFGGHHSCALLLDGTVKCWGGNNYGQLGDGTRTDRWVPVSVSGITNAVAIATTNETVCAALSTGAVKCWGYGGLGLLGNGNGAYTTTNFSTTPVTATGVANAVSVSADWVNRTFCATTTIGEVYCWGGVASSVPGLNGPGPVKITGVTGAKQFIPGGCWITASDTVKCFSALNNYGELGNGTKCTPSLGVVCPATNAPGVTVSLLSNVVQIAGFDSRQYCARLGNGTIYCWGDNIYGIVANKTAPTPSGFIQDRQVPTPLMIWQLSAPPVITASPTSPSNATAGTVSFSADAAAVKECKIDTGAWVECTSPYHYSGLAGGSHTFSVRSTETGIAGGNPSAAVSTTFTIDATPPLAPTITSPATTAATVKATSGTLTFTAEAGARIECQLDGGAWSICTSPFAYSGLAEGSHTFNVRATDAAGNVGPVATRTWPIKTSVAPPVLTRTTDTDRAAAGLTLTPDHLTNSSAVWFSWTAEPAGTFQCSLDGGAVGRCPSAPFDFSGTARSTPSLFVTEGPHTFWVRQTDMWGNISDWTQYSYIVDLTPPPAAVITSGPSGGTSSSTATFEFTSVDAYKTECKLDYSRTWTPCTSPVTYTSLAPGRHNFTVRALDLAGNTPYVDDTDPRYGRTWTIGVSDPALITSAPTGTVGNSSGAVAFFVPAGSTAVCSIDGGAYQPCTSPVSLTGLSDGAHSVDIKRVHPLYGLSTAVTANWVVDTMAPVAPVITNDPDNPTKSDSATVEFTLESGSTAKCQIDGGVWAPCTSPLSLSGLAEGGHTVKIKSVDGVGNESAETVVDWTVDTTAPDAPSLTKKPAELDNSAAPVFNFQLEEKATAECQLDGGDWIACDGTASYSGLIDGSHTFSVRQTDEAGNVSPQTDYTWSIDTTAPLSPTITAPLEDSVNKDDALTFSPTGSEVNGLTYKCQIDGGDVVDCTSPVDISGLSDGSHTLRLWALDALGNQSEVAERNWTRDTVAPAAPTIGNLPANGTSDLTASLTLDGAGSDETYQCSVNGGAWTDCVSPVELSGLTNGRQIVQVRIVDPAGNIGPVSEASWSIGVYVTDPVVTSPADGSVTADNTVEFTVQADTTTTCSLDGSPPFECSSPYDTSGLPEGVHTLDITSTDADGHYATKHFEWTIDRSAPGTPEIANVPQSGTPADTASLTLTGAETGDVYECSVNGGEFATCSDPLNLSGLSDGLNSVSVRIKDEAGNVGEPSEARWLIGDKMVMPPTGQTGSMTLSGPASFRLGSPALQTFGLSTFNFNTIWPAGARTVIVSNSPSFTNSKRFPVYSTSQWGNPVAKPGTFGSRTVYFKYLGSGIDQSQVYTSTFRWDRAAPYIVMAARKHLLGYKPDAWKVRLTGKDRGPAGFDKVQFWMRNDKMPKAAPIQGAWHSGYVTNFSSVITVPGGHQPIWVRASDRAGNWSRWYLIK